MATDTSSDKDTNVLNRSGLNPRRACMKRALTLLACVCKPAAANLTSNNERSQAWHSATDRMRPSPSSASTSASDPAKLLCSWRTRACALHEHERLHHKRHTACDVALLRLSWPLGAPRTISFMLRDCLHRHRACARWSRLRSTRSQPSSFAADGAAPANSGGGASARQTMEANKGAVGVAMQFLVMMDKLHDMHQKQVVSDSDFAQWSNWAREHVTRLCRM